MRQLLTLILFVLFLVSFSIPPEVDAKRKLPSSGGGKKVTITKPTKGAKGVATRVSFQPGKRGIVATFSNLEIAERVSYSLIYSSRGIQEGAGGQLTTLSSTQTRELLFGTCSAGVCRYHPNPKNARFIVTTTLKDGRKVSKVFRLKV